MSTPKRGSGRASAARRGTHPPAKKASAQIAIPADTRERILVAAEDVLRRHGAARLTVMDVARALGMSHANIYRHFTSRTELHDALVERWLQQVSAPLAEIAARPGPASERMEEWLLALIAVKRRKVLSDPELFEAYHAAAEAARDVVDAYLRQGREYLATIVRDGVEAGEFSVSDVEAAVTAIRDATARFVDPHYIRATASEGARKHREDAKRVLALIIAGLRAGGV